MAIAPWGCIEMYSGVFGVSSSKDNIHNLTRSLLRTAQWTQQDLFHPQGSPLHPIQQREPRYAVQSRGFTSAVPFTKSLLAAAEVEQRGPP